MISENDRILSYYEPLSELDGKEHVELVKHTVTGQLYVKKTLSVYDRSVFEFIRREKPQNVPEIIEILQEGDELIVIEEYFSGRSVREVLSEHGPLSVQETLRITEELVRILIPFHSIDPPIVHRDIKPENLLLSSDGVLKLVDFNAAKTPSENKTRDTELFGTVGYAAPEQYGFAESSPATDIYAVGMLMCELSTGTLDLRMLPPILRPLVEKCTRIDPADRFRDASELSSELSLFAKQFRLPDSPVPIVRPPKERASVRTLPEAGKNRRRFLPPGFRTGKWWKIVLGIHGYVLILLISWAGGSTQDTLMAWMQESVLGFVTMILSVLVDFNYLGIWSKLPLLKSQKPGLRILGLVVYPVLIFSVMLFLSILFAMVSGSKPHG